MGLTNVGSATALLAVLDMRKSVAWYRDILGFEVVSAWEPEGQLHWAMLQLGGASLMLNSRFEDNAQAAAYQASHPVRDREDITLYFSCDSVDDAYRELLAKGCPVKPPETAFYGMRQLYLHDLDGYQLCFQHSVAS